MANLDPKVMSSLDPLYAYKIGWEKAQLYPRRSARITYMVTWMIVWFLLVPVPMALGCIIGFLIVWVNRR